MGPSGVVESHPVLDGAAGLEGMADPKNQENGQMLEWYGGQFDPDEAEIGPILDNFERLAKKWAPKPRKPKAVPKRL